MGIFNNFLGKTGDSTALTARNFALAAEQALACEAEIARNAASLKAVTSRVMIADQNHVIVSVNDSAHEMMQEAEADLRADLPGFSASRIVGSNIDIFHKNPAGQHAMLEKLTSSHKGRIAAGGRTFDLIATPLFGPDKRRIGTVVEWLDLTRQLAQEKIEQEKREQIAVQAADNERIRQALDAVTTNVMMADANYKIIYANDAVLGMLKNAEQDLRKELPHFSANAVLGNSIDIFHRNPEHQRKMLQRISTTFTSRIKVGGRSFNLIATPVVGINKERLGTVVEWQDNTQAIKQFEQIVNTAISAAANGNLAERIDASNLTDYMANFATGFNKLMEIFETVINSAARSVKAMAIGDLSKKMQGDCKGKFAELKNDINGTIEKLALVVRDIQENADSVKNGAVEIAGGNTNLSQRTESQAASLEETSAAMEQVTATVQQTADNAVQANLLAKGAREAAETGGAVVGKAIAAMKAISDSSNKINDIISVIDEIAFQTNLLALNAAVEAARAGDQGKGFAVVANEVRNLAGRSSTAAKAIKLLIKDGADKVNEGSALVNKSGETLATIVHAVQKVYDIVAEISVATDEQATSLNEINRAISDMDDITQQNAALVEEAAAASESLGDQADALRKLVAFFQIGR